MDEWKFGTNWPDLWQRSGSSLKAVGVTFLKANLDNSCNGFPRVFDSRTKSLSREPQAYSQNIIHPLSFYFSHAFILALRLQRLLFSSPPNYNFARQQISPEELKGQKSFRYVVYCSLTLDTILAFAME